MNQEKLQSNPTTRAVLDRLKGALIWFALVALGCLGLWSASREPQGALERAQSKAARAVEWSLAGDSEKLNRVMTQQAAQRAAADRSASGLDRVLTASGQSVKARAESVEATLDKGQWTVRGLATATLSGSQREEPWRGAWEAHLASDVEGELRVSSLRMSSLPAGAPYNVQGVAQALLPPVIIEPVAEPRAKPEPEVRPRSERRKTKPS